MKATDLFSERALRLECLRLASATLSQGKEPKSVISLAETFYEFATRETDTARR